MSKPAEPARILPFSWVLPVSCVLGVALGGCGGRSSIDWWFLESDGGSSGRETGGAGGVEPAVSPGEGGSTARPSSGGAPAGGGSVLLTGGWPGAGGSLPLIGGMPSTGGTAPFAGGALGSGGAVPLTGGALGVGGGARSTGGAFATGGTVAIGGAAATGGAVTGGGATASGGTATGGAPAIGGTEETGGIPATGGYGATGGTMTGGATATGGTVATGGIPAAGGTGASAGMTNSGGVAGVTGVAGAAGTRWPGGTAGIAGTAGAWPAGGVAGITGDGASGGVAGVAGHRESGGAGGSSGSSGHGGASECPALPMVDGVQVVYDRGASLAATPEDLGLFEFPWPELSRSPEELSQFPNPSAAGGCMPAISDPFLAELVLSVAPQEYRDYVALLSSNFLTEAANQAQILMRFDGAIDEAALPSSPGSLDPASSSVLLVDLAADPGRGRLVPVLTRVLHDSLYARSNTLSILPVPGFSLEPGVLHAAVVLRSLRSADAALLGSPAAFEALKAQGDCAPDATYESAFDRLESELAITRDQIAMMTVFRAGDPIAPIRTRLDDVDDVLEAPSLADLSVDSTQLDASGGFYRVRGSFENLIVQQGTPPYLPAISIDLGGNISVGLDPETAEGRMLTTRLPTVAGGSDPLLPRTERSWYELAVPVGVLDESVDPSELPLVIYGPGTGGSINSVFNAGIAEALAAEGIASLATTPVMHDERSHSDNLHPGLVLTLRILDLLTGSSAEASLYASVEAGDLFFNPLNLQAAKGNSMQAAVDYTWQARVFSELVLPLNLAGDDISLQFAPERIGFFGHSQGAATGPLLATSGHISSQALSAPSGHLSTNLLGKTEPSDTLNIASMLDYLICDDPAATVDVHHPWLNLLLHWFEEVDAANHAPFLIREAPAEPKHVFVLAGSEDHYVAPGSHDAVTTAARLHQLAPERYPVLGQELLALLEPGAGYALTYDRLSGNLQAGGSSATGAFRQYHDPACSDDHFVATCMAEGWSDWAYFFATWASGLPAAPAP